MFGKINHRRGAGDEEIFLENLKILLCVPDVSTQADGETFMRLNRPA